MIIRRSLRLVIFSFDLLRRWRGPCPVALPFAIIPSTSFRSRATPSLYRGTAASFPVIPRIPFIAIPVPVSTSTRAARPVTTRSIRRWRPSVSVIAPDRGWRILRPLDTQTVSIEVPAVPDVVVGILRVAGAAEFHKCVRIRVGTGITRGRDVASYQGAIPFKLKSEIPRARRRVKSTDKKDTRHC